jgi:nickel transport protein
MKSFLIGICCSIVLIGSALPSQAHGVEGAVERGEGYCVTVQHDDGEPMGYAAVEIKAPDSELAFQKGRTDRNGGFMFQPDAAGRWQVVVQDGMGHRLALDVDVNEDPAGKGEVQAGIPVAGAVHGRFSNTLTGLAIIFGLCGLIYGWRARRQFSSLNTNIAVNP